MGDPAQVTVPEYPLAVVTVVTGVPPVVGTVTPPIAGTEMTVGLTAVTVVVKVAPLAVETSFGLPPNSTKYAYALLHGRSFHMPTALCQFVTAQSSRSTPPEM